MQDIRWPHPPLDRDGDATGDAGYWRRPGERVWHVDPPPVSEPIEVWSMRMGQPPRPPWWRAWLWLYVQYMGVGTGVGLAALIALIALHLWPSWCR